MKAIYPLLAVLLAASGCQMGKPVRHIAESPEMTVSDKGAIAIKGDSVVQPKVETKKTETVLNLPEGSTFDFNEKMGTMRLTLSKATQIALNRTETALEGPRSFTPDKAPTIKEEKQAESDFWVNIGLKAGMVLGGVIAIFGLVRGWDFVMYGGGAVSLACAFGIFIEKHPVIMLIVGIGAALAIIGPYLWHTKLKHVENKNPPS